jgi:hypothetical protein
MSARVCGARGTSKETWGGVPWARAEPATAHPAIKAIKLIFMIDSDGLMIVTTRTGHPAEVKATRESESPQVVVKRYD